MPKFTFFFYFFFGNLGEKKEDFLTRISAIAISAIRATTAYQLRSINIAKDE